MNHVDICSADVGWTDQVCFETWISGHVQGVALAVYIVESLRDKYNILP